MNKLKFLTSLLFFSLIATVHLFSQTVFEENFEQKSVGLNLTTEEYVLTKGTAYTGTVMAIVAESSGNRFARMNADVNASANMQIAKVIDVVPGTSYIYEVESKGPFKRQLRVLTENDVLLASSEDYKPATTDEETTWKKMQISFIPAAGVNKVKIGFLHYWSGTIDLDNFKVYAVVRQIAYYLSSSAGDDNNVGTKAAPWKSLNKISATKLLPGDSVLFKRGDEFKGRYVVNGSGNELNPIFIGAYGEGEKPIINGQVGSENGGDFEEAILVENCDNLIFDGLEISNERLATRSGVADTDAYGMYVKNSGSKVMRNLIFRNMNFKNTFAVDPFLDFDKIQVAGLSFFTTKNTVAGSEKNIDNVKVHNCYFANNQRLGIQFKHGGGVPGIGNDSINRNMNIHIHDNVFYYNGGTGVLPNRTYNCLIENNLFDHPGASNDSRMAARGSSIWNIWSINTIMQYNTCLSTRGNLDSYGIHIDIDNINTFVQYNYMDDCIGGFVEILRGNKNAVYRFNVSVNSGFRESTWTSSNSTIYVYSDRWTATGLVLSDSVFINNNTVVLNKPFNTTFNLDAKNIFVYNNIFSSTNGAGMGNTLTIVRNNDTPFTMTNNLFEGTINQDWVNMDANPQKANPKFIGSGEKKEAYNLQAESPAINNGIAISGPIVKNAGYGVFKNIPAYPNVDLYGNPIDLSTGKPNIGASNKKNENTSVNGVEMNSKSSNNWLVNYQSTNSCFQISNNNSLSGTLEISLINIKGQVLLTEKKVLNHSLKTFDFDLNSSVSSGIYFLNFIHNGEAESHRIVLYR